MIRMILKQTRTLKQVQGDMSTCQLDQDDNASHKILKQVQDDTFFVIPDLVRNLIYG
jgi:hypothetical protein